MRVSSPSMLLCTALLCGCAGSSPSDDPETGADTGGTPLLGEDPETGADTGGTPPLGEGYAFASRLDGTDSVSYSGQVFRQALIEAMKARIGGLTARIDEGFAPEAGDVAAELEFYLDFDDSTSSELEHGLSFDPAALQSTWGEISTDKDLTGKIAGNDPVGQHRDWSKAFGGWGGTDPEALVRAWIQEIDELAGRRLGSDEPVDPEGTPLSAVYLTEEGQDLQQLLEKFLRGAIAFSQSADDYLDDDEEGKGLLADHSAVEEGKNYTALEHAWDEGFGYFGAARTYGSWTDAQIADPGARDVDGDGRIDLLTEVSWGHSGNAAKRDLGAVVATDFTAQAWDGFMAGRTLLASTDGPLTDEELDTLRTHRDQALEAWEKALAATVVHYINDTIQDMDAIGTDGYDFATHAKHWSEAKGFALAFQFNPHSPLSDEDFAQLHAFLGESPAIASDSEEDRATYRSGLLSARALLAEAYDFDDANMGDDDGLGGW